MPHWQSHYYQAHPQQLPQLTPALLKRVERALSELMLFVLGQEEGATSSDHVHDDDDDDNSGSGGGGQGGRDGGDRGGSSGCSSSSNSAGSSGGKYQRVVLRQHRMQPLRLQIEGDADDDGGEHEHVG